MGADGIFPDLCASATKTIQLVCVLRPSNRCEGVFDEHSPTRKCCITDTTQCKRARVGVVDEDSSSHDSGHDFEQGSSSTANGNGEIFHCAQRNSSEEEEDVERSSVDEGIDIESQHSSLHENRKNSFWWQNNETVKRYLKVLLLELNGLMTTNM